MNNQQAIECTTKTHKELSAAYDVSRQTLYRWLKPIAKDLSKFGHAYTAEQVAKIFAYLGPPLVLLSDSL